MPASIAVLLGRGCAKRDLKKIRGENYFRVIREVTGK
jgi:microsomal dipeptidase-like Zn-dependent dipeptidase